jgi:DNA-binding transcriptional MerR regulator
MESPAPDTELPPIPAKRYFTIGEVSELCRVKAHVLRYWEQEFTQLKPLKRRGNRRYYQHHEVLLVRQIRQLLYRDGFTISGARGQLDHLATGTADGARTTDHVSDKHAPRAPDNIRDDLSDDISGLRRELTEILDLLRA